MVTQPPAEQVTQPADAATQMEPTGRSASASRSSLRFGAYRSGTVSAVAASPASAVSSASPTRSR